MLKLEHTRGAGEAGNTWLLSPRRERLWFCEACDRAPAVLLCKADAASLCAACDADIHSANPLARRHHRVPIVSGGLELAPPAGSESVADGEDEDEAASWLLLNPLKSGGSGAAQGGDGDPSAFCGVVDEYLDLRDFSSCQAAGDDKFNGDQPPQEYVNCGAAQGKGVYGGGGDGVVPIQVGLDYEPSNVGYGYHTPAPNTISPSPLLDVGLVPESTITTSVNSITHMMPPKGNINFFVGPLMPIPGQLSPMEREARVLRYREKKKARKFEKTIRYASRKAYAETRPRIKGRFAKRTEVIEVEVDQMFCASVMGEGGYGIVPSFLSS